MFLFIYKTVHINGKYYIGRHSTPDINDQYLGSGKWIKSIKNQGDLRREILEFASTNEELYLLEEKFISEHWEDPNCMNYIRGSNGWTSEDSKLVQRKRVENGTHHLLKRADGSSVVGDLVKNGTHHLLKRADGSSISAASNAKRVADGTHNFLGGDGRRSQAQINAENKAWAHLEETVPCYNKEGKYVRITAELFYAQTGEAKDNEWVHSKSVEGIKRKNNGTYVPTRAKGKVPCYNKLGEYKRIPKEEYYAQAGDPIDREWVHFSSHEGKRRGALHSPT